MSNRGLPKLVWTLKRSLGDFQGFADVVDSFRTHENKKVLTIEVYKVPDARELSYAFDLRPPYEVKSLMELADEVVAFGACARRLKYATVVESVSVLWAFVPRGALPGIAVELLGSDGKPRAPIGHEVEEEEARRRAGESDLLQALEVVFGPATRVRQAAVFAGEIPCPPPPPAPPRRAIVNPELPPPPMPKPKCGECGALLERVDVSGVAVWRCAKCPVRA